jgi:hypothetical protein
MRYRFTPDGLPGTTPGTGRRPGDRSRQELS